MLALRSLFSILMVAGAGSVLQAATTCVGAELYSKSTVRYGRWEIRMQAAAIPGSVSSFFTYYNNSYMGAPEPWREIDIEVLGKNGNGFQSNLITGDASSKETSEKLHTVSGLNSSFHTYVLDWTPDSVVWRVDGKTMRKTSGGDQQVTDLRDKDETYRMNLWASSSVAWVGALDLSKLPIYQVVNWMRYSSYTPGTGDAGSDFTFSWLDDFVKFDTKRWAGGNWTFDGNLAQLDPANIVVKNGYLVLALTRPGEEGVLNNFATDPAGSTYVSTAVKSPIRDVAPLKVVSTEFGIRIDGQDAAGQAISVMDPKGRLLAKSNGAINELRLERKGILLVKVGESTFTVIR